jgi:hypothetical protein
MGKQSLSYSEYESKVWVFRHKDKYEARMEWATYALLGVFIGATAYVMDLIEESLVHFKDHYTQH